jgi:hypothetical protein
MLTMRHAGQGREARLRALAGLDGFHRLLLVNHRGRMNMRTPGGWKIQDRRAL